MTAPPLALLFDLGGVLIDVDFGRALAAWSPYSALPPEALRRAFRVDAHYERHERGEIDSAAYFAHLARMLLLDAAPEEIEAGWNAILTGEIAETLALVEAASRRLPCHVFSNTNACHMRCWSARYPRIVAAMDRVFVSHQLGLRKPEPAAFAAICHELALAPEDILFFDDLEENVRAAVASGLRGVQVRSPADVAEALRAVGAV